ncbi:MAG: family 43 glycosylhydrolase, partial [Polyangia bacterium]|nr:family 43 glycosylhydrolase [Polyangia bacterium]
DNIYAPSILRVAPSLVLMWYGGQGSDGHDRIFLATSTDGHHFHHYPSHDAPVAVLDRGTSNHVNDPSVVKVQDTFYMYYTDAAVAEDDRIHLAISPDGVAWTKQGMVIDVGSAGSWDDFKVGRPSVTYESGTFYLYYDGNDGTHRHVGLATSTDGYSFTRHPANPLVLNAGAVDVQLFETGSQPTVVMLREAQDGVYASTSGDGVTFCDQGRIAGLSGAAWDAYGHVTPFAWKDAAGAFAGLWVGGASHSCWCKNRIGELLPSGQAWPADPSEGCSGCLGGAQDCAAACRAGGYGVEGFCANPGSTTPSACCACVPLP